MGHKGVSKRKPPKAKAPKNISKGENDTAAGATRISEIPAAQTPVKGEPISVGKSRKKK